MDILDFIYFKIITPIKLFILTLISIICFYTLICYSEYVYLYLRKSFLVDCIRCGILILLILSFVIIIQSLLYHIDNLKIFSDKKLTYEDINDVVELRTVIGIGELLGIYIILFNLCFILKNININTCNIVAIIMSSIYIVLCIFNIARSVLYK